jgi:hypothetical protein
VDVLADEDRGFLAVVASLAEQSQVSNLEPFLTPAVSQRLQRHRLRPLIAAPRVNGSNGRYRCC